MRVTLEDVLFVSFDISITVSVAVKAPTNAENGNRIYIEGAKQRRMITNSPAPAFTPMMFGAQRSLPVAC